MRGGRTRTQEHHPTSRSLLRWWFETEHLLENADGSLSPFHYYFAQREAVESLIWLYDVRHARDKFDLLRFDASGAVSSGMFDEDWPRYVLKMATGAGKTKVLSLLIAWSFFHRLYEPKSNLSRNFLVSDDVGVYLEKICPELQGAVLVIHTKKNGEISEAVSGKSKEELERLRKQANEIDLWASPYKAIVSVLVLKEGWDVRNVTTIVGLRAYAAKSNILPEQTLGRGLRRMYFGTDAQETVSVMGTPAFMEFVESIQSEGVTFEHVPMGAGAAGGRESVVVEVDANNPDKDLDALEIAIPTLTRRFHRDFKDLDGLNPAALGNTKLPLKPFTQEDTREIVFKLMLDAEIHHTVQLDGSGPADYRSVVAFFARQLLKELRLVGGYDVLYGKVKAFIRESLFQGSPVSLEDPVLLRNLSEPEVGKLLFDSFKKAINSLTIHETGTTRIEDRIRLRDTRPFRTDPLPYLAAAKSVFNKTVGERNSGGFELSFAAFLEAAPDVAAFAKSYPAVGFRLDYVKADGDLSNYTPDFVVRTTEGTVWIVETKGREEIDVPQKMARLRQWCEDATAASASEDGKKYRFVFVDQKGFERHPPKTMSGVAASFTEYQA